MAVAEMEVAAEAESRRWVEKPFFFFGEGGGEESVFFIFCLFRGEEGLRSPRQFSSVFMGLPEFFNCGAN
jgi:hypothetical protein